MYRAESIFTSGLTHVEVVSLVFARKMLAQKRFVQRVLKTENAALLNGIESRPWFQAVANILGGAAAMASTCRSDWRQWNPKRKKLGKALKK
jgi:hypothetical protein